jgi:hypothetical protein
MFIQFVNMNIVIGVRVPERLKREVGEVGDRRGYGNQKILGEEDEEGKG